MIDKEEQEEPLVDKEQNKSKKKIILIILAIIGVLVTIGAIIIIVFIAKEKYDDTDNNKKDDQKEFEYGLTLTELQDRTNSEHLGKFIFLNHNSEEYTTLQEKDKQALKYLVKAAMIMDEIALRLDNVHNIYKPCDAKCETCSYDSIITNNNFSFRCTGNNNCS